MATAAMAPAKAATSVFVGVPEAPADPILGLNSAFLADEAPDKISLGVGAFRTDEGKPYVLPVVKRVEQQLVRLGFRPRCVFVGGDAMEVGACCTASWPGRGSLLSGCAVVASTKSMASWRGRYALHPWQVHLFCFWLGSRLTAQSWACHHCLLPTPPLSAPLRIVQCRRRIPLRTMSTCPLMACPPFKS